MSLVVEALDVAHASERRLLVEGVAFALRAGALLGVVGPNGVGKSTLLRCLAGVVPPASGTIVLDGRPIDTLPRRVLAQRIAYLPQSTPMHVDLSVRELVGLGRIPYRSRWQLVREDDDLHVQQALERVGMQSLTDRRVHTLSGGELQRVMMARMLATQANVLVLDEPTAALDAKHTFECLELCQQLARNGTAIIIALHDLEMCRRYADAVVCLGDPDAAPTAGPPAAVLTPARIARVFGVRAELTPQGLSLWPNPADPAL